MAVRDWCNNLRKWRGVVLGRSLGTIQDRFTDAAPDPQAEAIRARADACPHASRRFDGCACVDRYCSRDGKIMSGADCLACVAGDQETG